MFRMRFAAVDKILLTGPSWVTGINTCRCTYVQYQPSAQTCQLSLRLRFKPPGAALILKEPPSAVGHMLNSSDIKPNGDMPHSPTNPLSLSCIVQIRAPRLMRCPWLHQDSWGCGSNQLSSSSHLVPKFQVRKSQ